MKIISKAKKENRKKYQGAYYERHHILPKSLFPNWAKRKENIVLLTAKEHYFCHELLMKIYPRSKEMQYAFIMLTYDGAHKVSMRDYEKAKILNSKLNSERLLKEGQAGQWKKGNKPWNYGKPSHLNEEYSKALSEGQKRRFSREDERRKNSERVRQQMAALTPEERKARAEQIRKTCLEKGINCKKIMCIETGEVFNSVKSASLKYGGHISDAAKGKRERAAGYHWKYV